jgi:putative FmdB family regulatory protein
MPLYEYECDACGGRFEVIQKFSETTETCRRCGKGPVRRLMSSPAIQFKGSGWYITDYAKSGAGKDAGKGASTETSPATPAASSSSSSSSSTETTSAPAPATPAKTDSK